MTVQVLVVDDHALVRAGVVRLIEEADGLDVAGDCESGEEALAFVDDDDPCDVVVLDVSMPGLGGLETLGELQQRRPELPVLMLSAHEAGEFGLRCLSAGALGYVTKGHRPQDLVSAIRTVAEGRRYLTQELSEALADRYVGGGDGAPHESLSSREFEVFIRLAGGQTPTEIGRDLCLSVKTVSTYRFRAMTKMGLTRTADLTAYAIQHGLIPALVG